MFNYPNWYQTSDVTGLMVFTANKSADVILLCEKNTVTCMISRANDLLIGQLILETDAEEVVRAMNSAVYANSC
jgi:hypothetical protein